MVEGKKEGFGIY
jgi:hypothetical protein